MGHARALKFHLLLLVRPFVLSTSALSFKLILLSLAIGRSAWRANFNYRQLKAMDSHWWPVDNQV
ncbi:hypothetical protein P692DRAFT_20915964 [Suillus brevipes Sb2]|nr:hypothetical protein P692DRAFT_20915964 [Suillus brevipes Sb2]